MQNSPLISVPGLLHLLLILSFEQLLDSPYQLPHTSKHISKAEAPPLNPDRVNEKVHQRPITDAEREEDAEIPPLISRLDVQRPHIVDPGAVLAVSTIGCGIGVSKISGGSVDEVLGVGGAG